ncbi:MAG: HAMP domain-containing sensor histidine kinase [Gemmatimonadales bacterium]
MIGGTEVATPQKQVARQISRPFPVFYEPPGPPEQESEAVGPRMGLPGRLAVLTAVMAVLLVLAATEIALSWSARTRLEDFRLESVALANTLASLLARAAPTGNVPSVTQIIEGWSRHITESRATVYVARQGVLVPVATSDSTPIRAAQPNAYLAVEQRGAQVHLLDGADPGWQVLVPLGVGRPYGVLDVRVSTRRLQDWARVERQRAYFLAFLSALLVALGVAVLTARWVGRPLAEIGRAMAGAHGGTRGSPPAPEIGPPEFRELARRYNRLRDALTAREQESAARAMLLSLEERARAFDRIALVHETAAGFAHEIGTPLNTMSGHLQLLRDDLSGQEDEAAADRVRLLLAQVDRVAGIVRAALQRGTWPRPYVQSIDLTEVVERMQRFLEPAFTDAGVTANVLPSVPVWAVCDPALVEQILLNLLKNAIEALSPGNTVTISTSAEGAEASIEIVDDGPGLDPEAEAHLFRPFSTTKGAQGTGLGLAVSRRLAQTLGGDLVWVPTDRGVRWRLTLPAPERA